MLYILENQVATPRGVATGICRLAEPFPGPTSNQLCSVCPANLSIPQSQSIGYEREFEVFSVFPVSDEGAHAQEGRPTLLP